MMIRRPSVIVTTTPYIPGYKIKRVLGIVYGTSIRTRGLGGRVIAGLEAIVGGRGMSYLQELEKAREEALEELRNRAYSMGANAVVSVDFETNEILEGFIVITAFGTAVYIEPEKES